MTRDEAIKVFHEKMAFATDPDATVKQMMDAAATHTIDAFAALGMLKLDEPRNKTAFNELEEKLLAYLSDKATGEIFGWMDDNGIEVVRRRG